MKQANIVLSDLINTSNINVLDARRYMHHGILIYSFDVVINDNNYIIEYRNNGGNIIFKEIYSGTIIDKRLTYVNVITNVSEATAEINKLLEIYNSNIGVD